MQNIFESGDDKEYHSFAELAMEDVVAFTAVKTGLSHDAVYDILNHGYVISIPTREHPEEAFQRSSLDRTPNTLRHIRESSNLGFKDETLQELANKGWSVRSDNTGRYLVQN